MMTNDEKTTRFGLMRHAETVWNREKRIQGQLDSPLTARGIEQAERAGKRLLAELDDPAAYRLTSSPLGRAHHTAALVARAIGRASGEITLDEVRVPVSAMLPDTKGLGSALACLNQGMTPQEALMGCTAVAARAVARADRIGSLASGFQADIAVIDAPSLNHWLYHFSPNACVAVFKNGQPLLNKLT